MSESAEKICKALINAVERVGHPGETNYFSSMRKLVRRLAEQPQLPWTQDQFHGLVEAISKEDDIVEEKLLGLVLSRDSGGTRRDYFQIVQIHMESPQGHVYRPTGAEDMNNPAMIPGKTLLVPDIAESLLLHLLAHNYCLVYPERLFLLGRSFPLPGASGSALSDSSGDFIFHRKVNDFITGVTLREGKELGLLEETSEGYCRLAKRLPAPLLASLTTQAYLQLTDHELDTHVDVEDLEDQLGFMLQNHDINGSWRHELGPAPPLFDAEVGGAAIRLTPEAFCWLVQIGVVDVKDVAEVLREMHAYVCLRALKTFFEPLVKKKLPRNAETFLALFDRPENG